MKDLGLALLAALVAALIFGSFVLASRNACLSIPGNEWHFSFNGDCEWPPFAAAPAHSR